MSLSMYQVSVPVFGRGLAVLSTLLQKASAHADETGVSATDLIQARLAPDMLPLAGQVQRASDTTKFAIERLTGVAAPKFADEETSFADLQSRIADTVAYFETVDPAKFEGSHERIVQLSFGEFKPALRGDQYLLGFVIPNFFFHVTTAHDILRHKGVRIGKLDYLGPLPVTAD